MYLLNRGYGTSVEDAFRKDYSRIAELRSILKRNIPFIVLTATATQSTKDFIINELVMRDCVQLITIPDKQNIRFSVSCIDINTLSVAFGWLIDEVRTKKTNAEKVLVFSAVQTPGFSPPAPAPAKKTPAPGKKLRLRQKTCEN